MNVGNCQKYWAYSLPQSWQLGRNFFPTEWSFCFIASEMAAIFYNVCNLLHYVTILLTWCQGIIFVIFMCTVITLKHVSLRCRIKCFKVIIIAKWYTLLGNHSGMWAKIKSAVWLNNLTRHSKSVCLTQQSNFISSRCTVLNMRLWKRGNNDANHVITSNLWHGEATSPSQ